ncbi:unnamed protein product, partial [Nesidiocoris tenuis]
TYECSRYSGWIKGPLTLEMGCHSHAAKEFEGLLLQASPEQFRTSCSMTPSKLIAAGCTAMQSRTCPELFSNDNP